MKIQWEEKRIFSFLWTHAYRPFSQFMICGAHSFSCSVTRACKSMKESRGPGLSVHFLVITSCNNLPWKDLEEERRGEKTTSESGNHPIKQCKYL